MRSKPYSPRWSRTLWRLAANWQVWLRQDAGSVTAEFAVALPAVMMVLAITLGAFALQIEQIRMVNLAASSARALAHADGAAIGTGSVDTEQAGSTVSYADDLVCVTLVRELAIPGLGKAFEIKEKQCARRLGQ